MKTRVLFEGKGDYLEGYIDGYFCDRGTACAVVIYKQQILIFPIGQLEVLGCSPDQILKKTPKRSQKMEDQSLISP